MGTDNTEPPLGGQNRGTREPSHHRHCCSKEEIGGSLNRNGPTDSRFYVWPLESGAISGLAGGNALLWRWVLMSSIFKLCPVWHSSLLLHADQDGKLLVPFPIPCLPACQHVFYHEENELNL